MIKENTQAPLDIVVQDSQGQPVTLRDTLGKPVVLFVYPKDNTPGCTTEACSFRDNYAALKDMGITLIGISADSPASHQKFAAKHALPYQLWSDPDRKLLSALGAIKEKSMFGKTFMGIVRSSFAITPEGKISKVWPKVTPNTHVAEVASFFSEES